MLEAILVDHLMREEGAKVMIADIFEDKTRKAVTGEASNGAQW